MKRSHDDQGSPKTQAYSNPNVSTLSVYTYKSPLAIHFIPASQEGTLLAPMISAVFGTRVRHEVFSLCSNAEGSFLLLDETLHRELFGGSGSARWSCLYIHESSTETSGAELAGALSLLCDRLATAHVPVLNVCTLARNFMLVKSTVAETALATLRTAVTSPDGPPAAVNLSTEHASKAAMAAGVRLHLLGGSYAIGSLSVDQLKACSHAILHLLFLQKLRPTFAHYFEMAGEISLALNETSLKALHKSEPASASALEAALEPHLSRGWRVLDITAPAGGDGIGILGAVCRPLASLPLMNFSTLDHTFVLFPEVHLDKALERLRPHFDIVHD